MPPWCRSTGNPVSGRARLSGLLADDQSCRLTSQTKVKNKVGTTTSEEMPVNASSWGEWRDWLIGRPPRSALPTPTRPPPASPSPPSPPLHASVAGWASGAATFVAGIRTSGAVLAKISVAAHHKLGPLAGAVCVAASGVSNVLERRAYVQRVSDLTLLSVLNG